MTKQRQIFRILSFDGGGIRGVAQAEIMRHWEILTGKYACSYFDLVAGTSTGSIMTAGITYPNKEYTPKYGAEEIVNLYKERGKDIFVKKSFWQNPLGLARPKYDNKHIIGVLNEYFGDMPFSSLLKNSITTSYDLVKGEIQVMKSFKEYADTMKVSDAVIQSCVAPTYFNPYSYQDKLLVDGGIYANNPTLCAYIEARKLGYAHEDIYILSIGTGQRTLSFPKASNWGIIQWLKAQGETPLIDIMLDAISDNVDYAMGYIFPPSNYLRLQFELRNEHKDMDGIQNIPALIDYGRKCFNANLAQITNFEKAIKI